jgi:hypothetical protein
VPITWTNCGRRCGETRDRREQRWVSRPRATRTLLIGNSLFLRSDRSLAIAPVEQKGSMNRFQLVFRRDGHNDQSGYRFNNRAGQPEIDGR